MKRMSFLNIHYTSGSVHDLIVTTPVHTLVVVQESLKKIHSYQDR
jgi:hypothetical protein